MTYEQKALALVNEVLRDRELPLKVQMCRLSQAQDEALCRALEQHENTKQEHAARLIAMHSLMAKTEAEHEAFRQEVSDAVVEYQYSAGPKFKATFERFIINKPDPLVEVIGELDDGTWGETKAEYADRLRAALEARGLEIREKNDV